MNTKADDDEARAEVRAARIKIIEELKKTGLFPDWWILEHFDPKDVGDRL